jgi:hypothetical protein
MNKVVSLLVIDAMMDDAVSLSNSERKEMVMQKVSCVCVCACVCVYDGVHY